MALYEVVVPDVVPVAVRKNQVIRPFDGVIRPISTNRATLLPTIRELLESLKSLPVDAEAWATSSYKPTPTIVEAAQALYRGHDVQEISRSEAGAENLSRTGAYIAKVIEEAKRCDRKAICFVTGVPGSGKTLAGLNIATERMRSSAEEHAVFLSGNGPLVSVLREALANDEVDRSKASEAKTVSKRDAYRHASAFIQNIHHFRDEYVRTAAAPRERVVVFDEAQRAWNREQATRFMREKRGHVDYQGSLHRVRWPASSHPICRRRSSAASAPHVAPEACDAFPALPFGKRYVLGIERQEYPHVVCSAGKVANLVALLHHSPGAARAGITAKFLRASTSRASAPPDPVGSSNEN
jgi:hypothetical protein